MVVEDVSVDDSPLRPAPALVVRVQCRKAALRCSRCGRKCPKYDDGGGERQRREKKELDIEIAIRRGTLELLGKSRAQTRKT